MGQRRGLVVDLLLLPSAAQCCCIDCQQPLQPARKTRGTTNRRLIAGLAPAKLLQTRACYFSASRCSGCASTLRATGRQLGRGLLGSASRPCCPASCTWGPRGLAAKQARAAASCRRRCSRSISRPLLVSTAGPTSRPHARRRRPPPATPVAYLPRVRWTGCRSRRRRAGANLTRKRPRSPRSFARSLAEVKQSGSHYNALR